MTREPVNLKASVAQKLRNIAAEKKTDYQLILRRYAIERLLYRLSVSPYREQFVLKGAMLFTVWVKDPFRATQDLDLLGIGKKDEEALSEALNAVCKLSVQDDALSFDVKLMRIEAIKGQQEEGGVRVKLTAFLDKIQIPVQIDIGFGDAITPEAVDIDFPPLLGADAPKLKAYPKETVVAEKYQAIVALGQANSRMKDYYDLVALSRLFEFDGAQLGSAIKATFERRGTAIPDELPTGLSATFSGDKQKNEQWKAFAQREPLGLAVGALAETIDEINRFISPASEAARGKAMFQQIWLAEGPWRAKS